MKKIIVTLAVALSIMCSFAGEVKVSSRVLDAFNSNFASAKEVSWTATNSYYKATFVFNDQHVFAFYGTDGELMGLTRYISSVDLPIIVITGSPIFSKYPTMKGRAIILLWKTQIQRLY